MKIPLSGGLLDLNVNEPIKLNKPLEMTEFSIVIWGFVFFVFRFIKNSKWKISEEMHAIVEGKYNIGMRVHFSQNLYPS